jgi:hypothetical protein
MTSEHRLLVLWLRTNVQQVKTYRGLPSNDERAVTESGRDVRVVSTTWKGCPPTWRIAVPGIRSVVKELLCKEKEECVSNIHIQEVLKNRCFWVVWELYSCRWCMYRWSIKEDGELYSCRWCMHRWPRSSFCLFSKKKNLRFGLSIFGWTKPKQKPSSVRFGCRNRKPKSIPILNSKSSNVSCQDL